MRLQPRTALFSTSKFVSSIGPMYNENCCLCSGAMYHYPGGPLQDTSLRRPGWRILASSCLWYETLRSLSVSAGVSRDYELGVRLDKEETCGRFVVTVLRYISTPDAMQSQGQPSCSRLGIPKICSNCCPLIGLFPKHTRLASRVEADSPV
jgi:hypothetical protein